MLRQLTAFLIAAMLVSPALAQHDHDDDHPDIEIELDGLDIHFHPEQYNLRVSHENYAFTKPTTTWRALFPGFEGEDLGSTRTFDLVSVGPLYEFDDALPDGQKFAAAANDYIRVLNASLDSIDVTGSSGTQTLPDGVGTTNASGILHSHPIFQLHTDLGGDPSDGAYLLELQIASLGLNTSDSIWVLFHKGLDDATYDRAIHEAEAQFGLAVVPEPASATLLGAGVLLWTRRQVRAARRCDAYA